MTPEIIALLVAIIIINARISWERYSRKKDIEELQEQIKELQHR